MPYACITVPGTAGTDFDLTGIGWHSWGTVLQTPFMPYTNVQLCKTRTRRITSVCLTVDELLVGAHASPRVACTLACNPLRICTATPTLIYRPKLYQWSYNEYLLQR